MKKKHIIISLLLAGAALYLTFKNLSYTEIRDALRMVQYSYLIYGTILILLTFVVRAVRWQHIVKHVKPMTIKELLPPLMIGFMGNMLPARAGEFIRAYLIGKKGNISFSSSIATVFIERVFDLLMLLMLLVWVLLFKASLFAHLNIYGKSVEGLMIKFGYGALALCLGLIIFCYMLLHATKAIIQPIAYLIRPFPYKFKRKVFRLIHAFRAGLGMLTSYKTVALVFSMTALEWFLIVLSNYPFFLAFNLGYLPYTALVVVIVMVGVFISLLPTPGYLGSFQLATVVALYHIYGVPEVTAASFGIITWGVNTAIVAVFGTYFLMTQKISIKELKAKVE
ncbi:MAG: lysylphosphatidylglycerol synthase transmembrane domain-containing protein [Nitrospinota bacterium]|nr:flippase-like domain-containing protein [Nitrospinota bacterium]